MASNTTNEDRLRDGDQDVSVTEPAQSTWRSTWQNNKGALLILASVVCGASMDAIARFLQQGGGGFHTLQVCTTFRSSCQGVLSQIPGDTNIHTRSSRLVWASHSF
jgi:hypothetical protein